MGHWWSRLKVELCNQLTKFILFFKYSCFTLASMVWLLAMFLNMRCGRIVCNRIGWILWKRNIRDHSTSKYDKIVNFYYFIRNYKHTMCRETVIILKLCFATIRMKNLNLIENVHTMYCFVAQYFVWPNNYFDLYIICLHFDFAY